MQKLFFLTIFLFIFLTACTRLPGPEVFSPTELETPLTEDIPPQQLDPAIVSEVDTSLRYTDSDILGIQIKNYTSEEELFFFENAGARWSRFDRFHWDLIEPDPQTPSVYDWSSVDETGLINAADRGMGVIGIILYTPPYAQKYPGSICGPIVENQLERFGDFLHALVTRYSQAPYNIKYWEIGNEPDVDYAYANRHSFGCWGDPGEPYFGGGYYAEMLKIVYPKIKAADSEAQVLIGGLLLDCDPVNLPETSPGSGVLRDCTSSLYLDGILENGGGAYFDGISFHAYDYYWFREGKYSNSNWHSSSDHNGSVTIPKASYLQQRLAAYAVPGKYLMNTESGLICGRDGTEPGCQTEEFARTKAAYTVHSNTVAFQLGLRANIWYSLMGWRASELLDANYTPLPAYDAYRFNASLLSNAEFKREVFDYPQLFVYEFGTPSINLWILWSRSGELENVQLPAVPSDVYDIFGNWITPSQDINVNYSPLYLVFTIQ